jgi:hypothetical protein
VGTSFRLRPTTWKFRRGDRRRNYKSDRRQFLTTFGCNNIWLMNCFATLAAMRRASSHWLTVGPSRRPHLAPSTLILWAGYLVFVVSDAATQIADLCYEARFRKSSEFSPALQNQVMSPDALRAKSSAIRSSFRDCFRSFAIADTIPSEGTWPTAERQQVESNEPGSTKDIEPSRGQG